MNRAGLQIAPPKVTPVVKVLLIACGLFFLADLTATQFFGMPLAPLFGFVPERLLSGWLWQPFTYAFLHGGVFHLLFNLLVIWTIGSELEGTWGSRTFLAFAVVCALGAALTHGIFSLVGIGPGAGMPVVGSSGIVFGLLLAYGILFGDRTMYFFMLFPMPARYFVLLLGVVELVSSIFYGRSGVAHLAHLGGMAFGFLFLVSMASWRKRLRDGGARDERLRQKRLKKASHLRLVPGKDPEDDDGPKHWN